ncbi:unnamed protein product [Effrenium voratum]|uniref:N-acetyltransferase domain-containing protein n=1 Tax=Effrenium voratum TaxID=2562239 RepID=A0AA36MNJ5_9DINO|nr:unnamed protein product [Effrenium voratum]
MGRSGALLAILALAALARCFVPAEMARAPRDRVARSAGGLINKLRAKSGRAKPELQQAEAALSSALPPGSTAPALRARCHELLKSNPEMLKAVSSASDFRISVMTEEDAQDLADLQEEWFPKESCRGGAPWCKELLAHEGVLAFKATLPQDETSAPVGALVALASRAAIEEFGGEATVDNLRKELTIPKFIPWDSPDRRSLGYVLSLGSVGEVRRRGLGGALLRRALAELKQSAGPAPLNLLGKGPKDTALHVVALHLADYNRVARACYEGLGFEMIKEEPESYAGVGRRTHSSLLYALFIE